MVCKSLICYKSDDDKSLFSVDTFKNRYDLARNFLICGDWYPPSLFNENDLIHNRKDVDDMDSPNTAYEEDDGLNSFFLTSKRSSNCSEFYSDQHELPHSIPAEIALLHEETSSILNSVSIETNSILDSFCAQSSRSSKHVISPIKDRFYREDRDSMYEGIYNDFDDDDVSGISLMSDDDGMRSELKRLNYVVAIIRMDMNQQTYHYDNLKYTQQDENQKDEVKKYGIFERLIKIFLLSTIIIFCYVGIMNNSSQFHGNERDDKILSSSAEIRCEESTKSRIEKGIVENEHNCFNKSIRELIDTGIQFCYENYKNPPLGQ